MQVVGKDIVRFHALIWPAMLLSLGLELPKTLFVHGFITVDGQKMSKSLGNVVDPFELVAKYGTDAVRYFLLRGIPSFEDGDFAEERFKEVCNTGLANDLGNSLNRTLTMAVRDGVRPKFPDRETVIEVWRRLGLWQNIENFEFKKALDLIWTHIPTEKEISSGEFPVVVSLSGVNSSVAASMPYNLTIPLDERKKIITEELTGLWYVAIALEPFFPETSKKIIVQLRGGKQEILFPRVP